MQCFDNAVYILITVTFGTVFLFLLSAHILIQGGKDSLCAVIQCRIQYHTACITGESVGKSSEILLGIVVGIFHIELSVQLFLAFIIDIGRDAGNIDFSIDVDAVATLGIFRIAVKAFQHHLHKRVVQFLMVNVQKEVSFGDFETDSGRATFTHCSYRFIIGHPCATMGIVCTRCTTIRCDWLFGGIAIFILAPYPQEPYLPIHQFLHGIFRFFRHSACLLSLLVVAVQISTISNQTGFPHLLPKRITARTACHN